MFAYRKKNKTNRISKPMRMNRNTILLPSLYNRIKKYFFIEFDLLKKSTKHDILLQQ